MKKIAISAESTIDLPKELLSLYDIHTLPYTIILGDKEYLDGEILPEEIFKFYEDTKTLPKTSAINAVQYQEYFNSLCSSSAFSTAPCIPLEACVKTSSAP